MKRGAATDVGTETAALTATLRRRRIERAIANADALCAIQATGEEMALTTALFSSGGPLREVVADGEPERDLGTMDGLTLVLDHLRGHCAHYGVWHVVPPDSPLMVANSDRYRRLLKIYLSVVYQRAQRDERRLRKVAAALSNRDQLGAEMERRTKQHVGELVVRLLFLTGIEDPKVSDEYSDIVRQISRLAYRHVAPSVRRELEPDDLSEAVIATVGARWGHLDPFDISAHAMDGELDIAPRAIANAVSRTRPRRELEIEFTSFAEGVHSYMRPVMWAPSRGDKIRGARADLGDTTRPRDGYEPGLGRPGDVEQDLVDGINNRRLVQAIKQSSPTARETLQALEDSDGRRDEAARRAGDLGPRVSGGRRVSVGPPQHLHHRMSLRRTSKKAARSRRVNISW